MARPPAQRLARRPTSQGSVTENTPTSSRPSLSLLILLATARTLRQELERRENRENHCPNAPEARPLAAVDEERLGRALRNVLDRLNLRFGDAEVEEVPETPPRRRRGTVCSTRTTQ